MIKLFSIISSVITASDIIFAITPTVNNKLNIPKNYANSSENLIYSTYNYSSTKLILNYIIANISFEFYIFNINPNFLKACSDDIVVGSRVKSEINFIFYSYLSKNPLS